MIAFAPVFLFVLNMKKILLIIICIMLSIPLLFADDSENANKIIKGFIYKYPAIPHLYNSIHPSLSLGKGRDLLPMFAGNITLGGPYFLEVCVGAGESSEVSAALTQYSFGLGIYEALKNREDHYYSLSLSLRNVQSAFLRTSSLVMEALVEQKVNNIYVGVGLDLISQDYTILEGSRFSAGSDRIYHVGLIAYARAGILGLRISGVPEEFNINFSVALNMEKTQ